MRKQWYLRVTMLLALIAALALAGCSRAPAQPAPFEQSTAKVPASSAASSGTPADSSGAPQEGIKVHGRWTIEVRNPDGTVAERREFENALASAGASSLTSILAREVSVGGWEITLAGSPLDQGAFLLGTQATSGHIVESSYASYRPLPLPPNVFATLLPPSYRQPGDYTYELVLSGTANAQRDGTIATVRTGFVRLDAPTPPSDSYYEKGASLFTFTQLTAPISVVNGQQIAVKVVISFS